MSWDDLPKLISTFGVVPAILIAGMYALHKTWIRLGRETTEHQAERERERVAWERDRAELIARYNEMKIEKDMWRDLAVKNAFTVERATDIAHTAMNAKGASMQRKD